MGNRKAWRIEKKLSVWLCRNERYSNLANNYWIRGLIQIIPKIGSLLDTWTFQFAEKQEKRRIRAGLSKLNKRVRAVERKLDVAYIEKHIDEFGWFFRRVFTLVRIDYRRKMREAYINLLVNFFTRKFSREENKEIYLDILAQLSPIHLLFLRVFSEYSGQEGVGSEKSKKAMSYVKDKLVSQGLNVGLVNFIARDLISKALINEVYHATYGGGEYSYAITKLGRKLLMLIEHPSMNV